MFQTNKKSFRPISSPRSKMSKIFKGTVSRLSPQKKLKIVILRHKYKNSLKIVEIPVSKLEIFVRCAKWSTYFTRHKIWVPKNKIYFQRRLWAFETADIQDRDWIKIRQNKKQMLRSIYQQRLVNKRYFTPARCRRALRLNSLTLRPHIEPRWLALQKTRHK